MNKATHKGTCQACGSVQKLPSGVLAKHGYTTKWGFFQGVCKGAGHLPFEQSTDLIQQMIDWSVDDAARLRSVADAALVETGNKTWADIYFSQGEYAAGSKGGHYWVEAEFVDRPLLDADGQPRTYEYGGETRVMTNLYAIVQLGSRVIEQRMHTSDKSAAFAASQRRYRAQYLRNEATRRDEYVTWQQARIAAWAPAELLPA